MDKLSETVAMEKLATKLMRRAQRLGLQPCDAEDMAQEALMRLMQRMGRSTIETPEHYAMIILHNLARARWRAKVELTELEEDTASTLPEGDSRLAVEALRHAIKALPADQAQIMQLVLQGELSPNAIAQLLDLPTGTVMSRLARARVTLRAQVGLDAGTPIATLL
ncbi:RNA polymerase sigma-70 factor (ECF subfamily) [Sulfitobacter undariae]|uniref:RNA polymerase sigma-70 factor (ECF subfamily) n=1 Tax=Sulfitobacter undariae TaxID=1563671 RepID=A0A7W6E319_9RHOB|nr:RNA polymerase sigma factor [Sulfitobacter undariae]MBB3993848.1 RNA polymerase sigma-70 factor (ECF subfamily) [Sulfitobacter undariae]